MRAAKRRAPDAGAGGRGGPRAIRATVAALALLLAAAAGARGETLPSAAASRWVEVRSRRFEITTQGDEAQARRLARHLERLAESLTETTRGFQVEGGKAIRVFVFRDPESFAPYSPFRDDDFGSTVGYHVSGPDAEYLAIYGNDTERLGRFVAHEFLHAVVAQSFGELPLWLNEGLAEYFSTFVARKHSVEIGRPIPEHVAWLKSHQFPVAEIFSLSGESPDYRGGARRQTVYAQSWALVHALVLDPEDSGRRFGRFLSRVAGGSNGAVALRATYGANAMDSLGPALRERVTRFTLPYLEREFAVPFEEIATRTRVLDEAESLGRLGELLAQFPDSLGDRARSHLLAAWRADSSRTVPASWLAALAERAGDTEGANRWHGRAIAGTEPRARGLEGNRLARRGLYGPNAPESRPKGAGGTALEARSLLEAALDSGPGASSWLVPYGLTFLQDTAGIAPGTGALLEARATWPRRTEIAGALAVLQLRAGNPGAALHEYAGIPAGRDRDWWRAVVATLLIEQARTRAQDLVREHRFAEAESLVAPLAAGLAEPGSWRHCADLLAWIRDEAQRAARPEAAASPGAGGRPASPPGRTGRSAPGPAGRGPSREARLGEYRRAMGAGAFGSAERVALEMARAAATERERSAADSLAAEARCRSALESAEELARLGSAERACERLRQVLADRPSAATRREAERILGRNCR